jgi:hypothetical protein
LETAIEALSNMAEALLGFAVANVATPQQYHRTALEQAIPKVAVVLAANPEKQAEKNTGTLARKDRKSILLGKTWSEGATGQPTGTFTFGAVVASAFAQNGGIPLRVSLMMLVNLRQNFIKSTE